MTPDDAALLVKSFLDKGFELRETHISWVFLDEHFAIKVKKSVDFGFLDFSTLALRKVACDAEVKLNKRLVDDVYLGVVPITRDPDGDFVVEGEGEPVEWAVKMRRLLDDDRADIRLELGRLTWTPLHLTADILAEFHSQARCDERTSEFGSADAIRKNVTENFAQTHNHIHEYISPDQAAEIEAWQLNFLTQNAELLEQRRKDKRVRDGHGDLRLEHLYIDDDAATVRILDCIEFNERFRYADVCSDVAFLAMDLAWHGRADYAERFLASYARASNDYDIYPLVDFYESYRAFVRGKIACLTLQGAAPGARGRLAASARRYFMLALASERRSLMPPYVVAIGGIIATGKSTIANALAGSLTCPVVDTDRTRKFMLGVAATKKVYSGAWSDEYGLDFTTKVYAEVLRRADVVVSSGRSVIIDASFRTRDARASAQALAKKHGIPFVFIECDAPHEVLRDRLRERAKSASVSDGRLEIFDDFVAKWESVDELSAEEHLVLNTDAPLESVLAEAAARVPTVE